MDQSRSQRESHLTKVLGTPAGRLYVLSEYKRAAQLPDNSAPPLAMPFSAMIEQILNREFPG